MFKEFKDFIKRGNVMDLAVAVILAAAFGKIIATLVEKVITPPIGLLLGNVDFANLFYALGGDPKPKTLAEAAERNIPVIAYGSLINDIITFLIVAFVVFMIVRYVNRLKKKEEGPAKTKDCPRCLSSIPLAATRCAECCIDLN